MCVKIVSNDQQVEFDMSLSIEQQVKNADHIEIDYKPNSDQLADFVYKLEKLKKTGSSINIKLKFNHNDYFSGAKMSRHCKELVKDLCINEFIKLMVLSSYKIDQKLEELASMCIKG